MTEARCVTHVLFEPNLADAHQEHLQNGLHAASTLCLMVLSAMYGNYGSNQKLC